MYGDEKVQDPAIQKKLLEDPNSLSTTLLINPEILSEISPTLPKGFQQELIPKEKCEMQLDKLLSCLIDNNFDNVKCEEFQFTFYECKKWRDSLLINRIKKWEIENFEMMNENEKLFYVDSLKIKKMGYIEMYESVEVIPANRGKRIRISSDIEQINWRIRYLEESERKTFLV
jgi:hypothetical protein